jgi:hypothetical protein
MFGCRLNIDPGIGIGQMNRGCVTKGHDSGTVLDRLTSLASKFGQGFWKPSLGNREDIGLECFPMELAADPSPGIIDSRLRVTDQALNLSFRPNLHTGVYRIALSIEYGIEKRDFSENFITINNC